MNAITLEQVESLFGSDEAIGVTFHLDDSGEILSVEEWTELFKSFPKGDGPSGQSFLPNGGSACCCTDYAHLIRDVLTPLGHRVDVVGFANEDNPESLCAIEEYHPGGHDFAIVDDRYLIDPWVRLVAAVEDQIFYDLNDPADFAKAVRIYGPREKWLSLPKDDAIVPPCLSH